MTTLHVREDALRSAVEPFALVRDVDADPDLPRTLRIEVREHVAVATVVGGGRRVAVAADGTLLHGARTGALPELTAKAAPSGEVLRDGRLRRAVALLGAAPAPLRARVRRVYVGSRGWGAPLRDGPTLWFGGARRIAAKWAAATAVLADATSAGATYVDVRLPEHPAAGGLEPLPSPSTSG
jgi:cell division protein FtsQ